MAKETVEPNLLEVLDDVLSAALREVRRARARQPAPPPSASVAGAARTSQPEACIDVLTEAGHALHVTALIEALGVRGIEANRDSLVSALSKRLAPQGAFIRTAPNTFGLAGRDSVTP